MSERKEERSGGQVRNRRVRGGEVRYLTEEDLKSVEDELSSLAKDIMEEWIFRQKQNPLEKAALAAFGEGYDWGGDKVKVKMDGVKAVVCLEHLNNMKKLLTDIVYNLPEVQQERFDVDLMLDGYCSYLKYRTKEQATICVNDHEVYEA